MFLKSWFDYIRSFWTTKEEMAKNVQNSLKPSEINVFRLLVNE